jgi:signal peptidase II
MAWRMLLAAGGVFAIDRASKLVIGRSFASGRTLRLGPALRVHLVLHACEGRKQKTLPVLWVGVVLVFALLVRYAEPSLNDAQTGFAIAMGGAAGNLLDRVRQGAVIDFIDLGWWPVFNLADVAIVLGTAFALWSI